MTRDGKQHITTYISLKTGLIKDTDLFKTNASIIHSIFTTIATTCPTPISCVVTNPVNSTLPVVAETLRKEDVFDPARLFGVTTLDVIRASTFIAHALGDNVDPNAFKVPVVGGHSGATILPLCSQAESSVELDEVLWGGGCYSS